MHPAQSFRKAAAATCALFAVGALFGTSALEDPAAAPQAGADVPGARPGRPPADLRIGSLPPTAVASVALAQSAVDVPTITALGVPVGSATRSGPVPVAGFPQQRQGPPSMGGPAPGNVPPGGGSFAPGGASGQPPSGGGSTVGPPSGGGHTQPSPAADPPGHDGGLSVDFPDVDTPNVEVPPATVLDVPVVGPVTMPAVAVSGGEVDPPAVSVEAHKGTVSLSTSEAEVRAPDIEASGAAVGPVRTSKAKVTTPDVSVSPGRVALGAEPDVELPEVKVSETEIETPDIEVAGKSVELPDVDVPEVKVGDDPVESIADTVGGLLGKHHDDGAEKADTDTDTAKTASDTTEPSKAEKSDDEAADGK